MLLALCSLGIWINPGTAQTQGTGVVAVPEKVLSSFAKLFPNASTVKWHQEEDNFEGKFMDGDRRASVLMGKNGELIEKELFLNVSELPTPAQDYLKKNFSWWKFQEIAELSNAKGSKLFEVESPDSIIYFDPKGKFLNVMAKENEEDQGEDD